MHGYQYWQVLFLFCSEAILGRKVLRTTSIYQENSSWVVWSSNVHASFVNILFLRKSLLIFMIQNERTLLLQLGQPMKALTIAWRHLQVCITTVLLLWYFNFFLVYEHLFFFKMISVSIMHLSQPWCDGFFGCFIRYFLISCFPCNL